MKCLDIITSEVHEYLFGVAYIGDNIQYSEYKLKKRIQFFKNRTYPTGKITEDGDYEFWFDIIHPAVNAEVKNLDFDTKHFLVFSKAPMQDFAAVYVLNLSIDEFMWQNGTAERLNEDIEDFSADGNILFRKTSDGYETCDMMNTFLTNTTARTVDETDIIERLYMTQADLRRAGTSGLFKNVDAVIENCGNVMYSKTENGIGEIKSKKMYEIYRRTGEISEKHLFEAQGKKGGDPDKYVLARIVVAGLKKGSSSNRYVLFAEQMDGKMSDYFVEAHRGIYKGKWWREGLYELLMDHQVRYNDISNQIARGLDWAAKVIFKHNDAQTLQNIRTQLKNGSLIKSESISQLEVRLQGFDQLINDRNSILEQANSIANSYEVVQGKNLPAQTAFRTAATLDVNANKLFVYLRQKISIAYRTVFGEFLLPELVKDIAGKDIIRLTGDPTFIDRFRRLAVDSWYVNNLVEIGPHTPEMAQFIKEQKFIEMQGTEPMIENVKDIWKSIMPRLQVTITGENYLTEEITTVSEMIQFEQDPMRRAFLLDMIYAAKGIAVPPAVSLEALQAGGSSGLPPQKESSLPVPKNPKEPVAS